MKSRVILLVTLSLLLLVLMGVTSSAALAVFGPLHVGQPGFSTQAWIEHQYLGMLPSPLSRVQFGLTLLERRIQDYELRTLSDQEVVARQIVSTEIDNVLALFGYLREADNPDIRNVFLEDLRTFLASLDRAAQTVGRPDQDLVNLYSRILSLIQAAEDLTRPLASLDQIRVSATAGVALASAGENKPPANVRINPHLIPFPAGSPGALHLFFPLDGKHSELSCDSCHSTGLYAGTPNLCSSCHVEAMPSGHYEGECSLCHSTTGWLPTTFTHELVIAQDCQKCHFDERPARHYPGQCSACHATSEWLPAAFDHSVAGAVDCQSCHQLDRPVNHYPGQCSACHATNAWSPATFNHQVAGAVDCQSCHNKNKPANHYSGQCSACHTTNAWKPASFNHQVAGAVDCQACHNNNKPANHYSGQCSACHSTNAWRPAGFNHQAAGATNCQACHAGNRPANHFSGQCSDCHNTSNWGDANFNHSFPINHGDANGQCSSCHPSGGSSWTCFNCHNESEMTKKHNEKGIADYVARCMECHGDGRKNED